MCQLRWLVLAYIVAVHLVSPAMSQPVKLTREQVQAVLRLSRNLSYKDLSGLDLAGLGFSGADLTNANLTDANLRGAQFVGAKLRRATLLRSNLQGAVLARADLTETDLRSANLEHVDAPRVTLTGSMLEGATLRAANLDQAELQGARLRGVDLTGARLTEARLIGADLREANLTDANLERATLASASLVMANLTRANLRRTRLVRTDFADANVEATNFDGSELSSAQNLDTARNSDKAIWQDRGSISGSGERQEATPGPITGRIVPKNGEPIDVESWTEQAETFQYARGGVTYGIAKENVRRVESAQGQVLREFVDKPGSGQARLDADCARPRIGDPVSYMSNYQRCVAKHGVRVTFSQGISARAEAEQAGTMAAPSRGVLVKRWEARDQAGRLIGTYEAAIEDKITLAGE